MKKIFALLIAVVALWGCSNNAYRIEGTIEGVADGDTITLCYSSNGQDVETVDKAIVKDGKFSFTGTQKGCKIFYIGYNEKTYPQYALFFLEPGNITAEISNDTYNITGTPTNDINKVVEDSLELFVKTMIECEDILQNDTTLAENEILMLANKSYQTQSHAMEFIKNSIYENIKNMVGLFLLVQYNDIFDNEELAMLIAAIPDENKDSENNPMFEILTGIQEMRTVPDEYEDFLDAIEEEIPGATNSEIAE